MTAARHAAATLLLAGCAVLGPGPGPTYGLVIVNDSDVPVFWSIEQPNGTTSRFEVEPCSSTSHSIDVGRAWEVEWGAAIAVASSEVDPLDAAVTVIEVTFDADGNVDVAAPRHADTQPGAPFDRFICVDR